jgi:hypothetical protein
MINRILPFGLALLVVLSVMSVVATVTLAITVVR